jgi:hypothetical protein
MVRASETGPLMEDAERVRSRVARHNSLQAEKLIYCIIILMKV